MLNPGFSPAAETEFGSRYAVSPELREAIIAANSDHSAGRELRTQPVYGDEIWSRLRELRVADLPWRDLKVLDACCGSGFLSYHLLRRVVPRELTLIDVSPGEVREAEGLIGLRDDVEIKTACADLAALDGSRPQFDVVIGNSFLHHFADVPQVLDQILRLLVPGGLFIGLHEPTPAALAWESGDPRQIAAFFLARARFMKGARHSGPGHVRPGTTDVWIFELDELESLLSNAGFGGVRLLPRYLARPVVAAAWGLHLGPSKHALSDREAAALRVALRVDSGLRRALPARFFGGLSFVARRPA